MTTLQNTGRLLGFSALLVALAGCGGPTVIGTKCNQDADCNVVGQRCAPSINGGPKVCTRTCTGETGATGCPIGYDCGVTDPAIGPTCNQVGYSIDALTGTVLLFGKPCALDETVCQNTGDPNPSATCRKGPDYTKKPVEALENDPTAYCSGSCTSNFDCPPDMECTEDWDNSKRCVKRGLCSECTTNDNCTASFPSCVATADGKSRYCTKTCNNLGQCGGFNGTFLTCAPATDAAGTNGHFCLHRYGRCVGEGEICDPCRTQADCQLSGSSCIRVDTTGERFCSRECMNDADCAGRNGAACNWADSFHSARLCTAEDEVLTCHP